MPFILLYSSSLLPALGEKTREHLQVNPSGMLPVAIINGRVISESNDIMQELEDSFPTYRPLLPPRRSKEEERVPVLLRLERRFFSVWFTWLTSRAGDSAAAEMDKVLKQIDEELKASGGPYFMGSELSLVDCMFAPFLERAAASLPYFKGFECRSSSYPHLLAWYEAMDSRPSYAALKSDYYTHCKDLPPQIGQCYSLPAAAPFAAEIDGGSWQLDFEGIEPMLPADKNTAKREAARSLLSNIEAVARFCSRGVASSGGFSRPSAPLADPNNPGNEAVVPVLDVALRIIAQAMLTDSSSPKTETSSKDYVLKAGSLQSVGFPAEVVRPSLLYLRDRVGVPRDMSVHAARQLRAYINLFLSAIAS